MDSCFKVKTKVKTGPSRFDHSPSPLIPSTINFISYSLHYLSIRGTSVCLLLLKPCTFVFAGDFVFADPSA